jgi:hypothetical protein
VVKIQYKGQLKESRIIFHRQKHGIYSKKFWKY